MLIIKATIRVEQSELARTGATSDELIEGIKARLHPVVSCHPDEMTSQQVEVSIVRFSDPRKGTFSKIRVAGGVPDIAGPWKLTQLGFSQFGYVHTENGTFRPVEQVMAAFR